MIINAANNSQGGWTVTEPKEADAFSNINKLNADLAKEEKEIAELNKEFAKHISNGEQDMAQLKSVAIQQKQMEMQAMRMQLEQLSNSDSKSNNAVQNVAETTSTKVGQVQVMADSIEESTIMSRPNQPARDSGTECLCGKSALPKKLRVSSFVYKQLREGLLFCAVLDYHHKLPTKTTNPNPSPTGKKFGLSLCGAGYEARTRYLHLGKRKKQLSFYAGKY